VDGEGKYVFAVVERFALRIKDPKAIVPLAFTQPATPPSPGVADPVTDLRPVEKRSAWRKRARKRP
jgi:hypothetical protein